MTESSQLNNNGPVKTLLLLLVAATALWAQPAEPDGRLYFLRRKPVELSYSRQLMMKDLPTGEPRVLVDEVLYTFDAADHQKLLSSPDGKSLALTALLDTRRDHPNVPLDLHLIDLATGKRRQLTRGLSVHEVAFSTDGRLIAASGTRELRILEVKTGKVLCKRNFFESDGSWLAEVAFRPASARVLVRCTAVRPGKGLTGLYEFGQDMSAPRLVDGSGGRLRCVLPDGRLIVSQDTGPKRYDDHILMLVTAEGKLIRELATDASYAPRVRLSPDGKTVLYRKADDNTLVSQPLEGGPAKVLVMKAQDADWSPDGEWIVFRRYPWKLIARRLDSGREVEIASGGRSVWLPAR